MKPNFRNILSEKSLNDAVVMWVKYVGGSNSNKENAAIEAMASFFDTIPEQYMISGIDIFRYIALNQLDESNLNDPDKNFTANIARRPFSSYSSDLRELKRWVFMHKDEEDGATIFKKKAEKGSCFDIFAYVNDHKEELDFDEAWLKQIASEKEVVVKNNSYYNVITKSEVVG